LHGCSTNWLDKPHEREGKHGKREPSEPITKQEIQRAVVNNWNLGYESCKRRGVALRFCEDSAAVVSHGEIAATRGVGNRKAALDSAQDGHVAVVEAIHLKIPAGYE